MISLEYNKTTTYPKIETLFDRDPNFKLDPSAIRKPELDLIKKWEVTEKIDGTNIRIFWNDQTVYFGGRTEKAKLPSDLVEWLTENIKSEDLLEVFGEKNAVLYGEGYGGNIQAGQNYCEKPKFILFDIRIGNFWLKRTDVEAIASQLHIEAVPFLGEMTNEEIIELVKKGFPSKKGSVPVCEGIIAKTSIPLYDGKGHRVIFKLKHKDF